ncbi:hypothetical protein A2671_02220 [Candidatus Kaiserbacteria bacterium RIFCSPHIGHO2_01_FULL_49_13]|uniref:Prepilin-type N-terminal cleavage/methylation domain-containing protein n=1 Tax=Candidatus Kaiserbacteria bacterium RIFCSPHIGHO2_01_FULL_49_13 TaxID=1798477 RepID=A0A1F6CDJ8_9BACT|nr:MAG: hypothetical protein A2671_02220 [Candidatus Kaiserbacteria bacterium RIFCSPHIGHO2_01_FULL_49_13]
MKSAATTRGFSLLETIVAIAVLSLAVAGPLSVVSNALKSAIYAKAEISAIHLAQEGIEVVRNLRDTNVLSGAPWLNLIDPSPCTSIGCDIQINPSTGAYTLRACAALSNESCELNYDSVLGLYNHEGQSATNKPSPFARTIRIRHLNDIESAVEVSVTWRTSIVTQTFTVRDNLLNWQ